MKRFIFLILLLLLLPGVGWGATYYVANDGDDDSLDPTNINTPWKTIAKVNASSFNAGDSILFKKGDTWRETLTVPSSGSSGSPITFGAYGTGGKPIISGADQKNTEGLLEHVGTRFKFTFLMGGFPVIGILAQKIHVHSFLRKNIARSKKNWE